MGDQPQFDPALSIELHHDWLLGRDSGRALIPPGRPPIPSPSPKIIVPVAEDSWALARAAIDHQDPLVRAAGCSLLRMLFVDIDNDTSALGRTLRSAREGLFGVRGQLKAVASVAEDLQSLLRTDIAALGDIVLPQINAEGAEVTNLEWETGWSDVTLAMGFLAFIVERASTTAIHLPARKTAQKVLLREVLRDLHSGGWRKEDVSRQLIDDSHNDPEGQYDRLRHLWPQDAERLDVGVRSAALLAFLDAAQRVLEKSASLES